MTPEQRDKGLVVASDGNMALAVCYLSNYFKIKATIFIPTVCIKQKVEMMRYYGKEWVELRMHGES